MTGNLLRTDGAKHHVLKAGVHRLRVSDCESGALDLFGVLAGYDRNGEIFEAATISPIEVNWQNETKSSCHQHKLAA